MIHLSVHSTHTLDVEIHYSSDGLGFQWQTAELWAINNCFFHNELLKTLHESLLIATPHEYQTYDNYVL